MQVNFYQLYKRVNSTKRPDTVLATLDCQLKEPCSILSPVLIVSTDNTIVNYNYCYIEKWKKYYFITDTVVQTGGRYEVSLSCDELASWKESIGRYTCFVERAASSYNSLVADSLMSNTENLITDVSAVTTIGGDIWDSLTGCFILRCVNPGGSVEGISSYVLSQGDLARVLAFMFTEDNFSDVLSDATVKSFFNPFQYIVSLMWLPIGGGLTGVTEENVKFGWWDTGVSAPTVSNAGVAIQVNSINVPENPYSDFRAYDNRFSNYVLYIPSVGSIPVNASDAQNGFNLVMSVDALTGICEIHLRAGDAEGDNPIIATYKTQIGVPIQIGQVNGTLASTATGAASAIGSLAGGRIMSGISQLVNSVQTAMSPTPSINGTNGARYPLRSNATIICTLTARGACEYPTTVAGRPLYANRQLSSFSGYVKCGSASIDIGGYRGEKETVNGFLNGGFYYE